MMRADFFISIGCCMYFDMSKETIMNFSLAREILKGYAGFNISLASDDLVPDFFAIVGDRGDERLYALALTIYQQLKAENKRRAKRKFLKQVKDEMCMTYNVRMVTEKMAA